MGEVLVPYGDNASETATLLLGAVEEMDDVEVFQVRNQPEDGGFRVPAEVAEQAGLDGTPDDPDEDAPKKRAAKKTAKKTASN